MSSNVIEKNKKGYIKKFLIAGLFSIICGVITGLVIFIFKFLAKKIEHFSVNIYELSKKSVWYIILVFLGLILLACVMYLIHKKIPESKGGGIPRSEGVLRGVLKFKSFFTLLGTFFGSMISYLAGVPVGTEGPAVLIGTSLGDLCNKTTKENKALGRYINTGGAAAGFAVATGAPLSGILFALEEIHKKFTPMLVATVSLSVLSATFVNMSLCNLFEMNSNLFHFEILKIFEFKDLLYLIILAVMIALVVGLYDKSIGLIFEACGHFLKKVHPLIKLIIVFVLTGILGYIYINGVYSGHDIIELLVGENGIQLSIISLFILLIIRFIMMHLVMESSVTGGIFIPTMAIAAVIGALLGRFLMLIGMSENLYPIVVILTMCVFIGGSLRAPFTAVVLFIELTGSFTTIFYVLVVMFIVNFIVEMFDQPSFYDRVLERMEHREHKGKERKTSHFTLKVSQNSFVCGKAVRDIMWPNSLVVLNIKNPNELEGKMDNDGERKLHVEDEVTIRCSYYDKEELFKEIKNLIGQDFEIVENQ